MRNAYESLIDDASINNVSVSETYFNGNMSGLYCDNYIFIDKNADYTAKRCILAEELGHHYTGFGDARYLPKPLMAYQEKIGRAWAFRKLLPIEKIAQVRISEKPASFWELAEALAVTEEFLKEALDFYRHKYGIFFTYENVKINLKTMAIVEE